MHNRSTIIRPCSSYLALLWSLIIVLIHDWYFCTHFVCLFVCCTLLFWWVSSSTRKHVFLLTGWNSLWHEFYMWFSLQWMLWCKNKACYLIACREGSGSGSGELWAFWFTPFPVWYKMIDCLQAKETHPCQIQVLQTIRAEKVGFLC
jgi:hypothetical protein